MGEPFEPRDEAGLAARFALLSLCPIVEIDVT
jgi:hypothetical protein